MREPPREEIYRVGVVADIVWYKGEEGEEWVLLLRVDELECECEEVGHGVRERG